MDVMTERPPFVRFERRPIEKRKPGPPDGDGSVYYQDVDFAIITPQGTKDVVEKPITDWFFYLEQMVKDKRYNPLWLDGFRAGYEAWKRGQTIPENGQPIVNWPVATPSEAKRLLELNIRTVEDLAVATEQALSSLGMGARSLKKRAQDWLEGQTGTGPLVTRLDALTVTNEELLRKLEESNARNVQLEKRLEAVEFQQRGITIPTAQPQGSLEDRLAAMQGPDAVDEILR